MIALIAECGLKPLRHSALLRDIRSTSAACRAVHPQGWQRL